MQMHSQAAHVDRDAHLIACFAWSSLLQSTWAKHWSARAEGGARGCADRCHQGTLPDSRGSLLMHCPWHLFVLAAHSSTSSQDLPSAASCRPRLQCKVTHVQHGTWLRAGERCSESACHGVCLHSQFSTENRLLCGCCRQQTLATSGLGSKPCAQQCTGGNQLMGMGLRCTTTSDV